MASDPTPASNRRHSGDLSVDDRLEAIETKLDQLLERTSDLPRRVDNLERVVYGGCALALTTVAVALLALVLKGHP